MAEEAVQEQGTPAPGAAAAPTNILATDTPADAVVDGINAKEKPADAPEGQVVEAPEQGLPEWREKLPDDLKNDPSIGAFKTVEDVVKSYVHAQKMVGRDKVPVPNEYSTSDEWNRFFEKVGKPQDLNQYEIKTEKVEELDEDFFHNFRKKAFEANLLPQQAQQILDWYAEASQGKMQEQEQHQQAAVNKGIRELQEEYGVTFNTKINEAKRALEVISPNEDVGKYITENYGNDPQVIRFLVSAYDLLREDASEGNRDNTGSSMMTPEAAAAKGTELMAHPAYTDKYHPEHAKIVAEVQRMFSMQFPGTVKKKS